VCLGLFWILLYFLYFFLVFKKDVSSYLDHINKRLSLIGQSRMNNNYHKWWLTERKKKQRRKKVNEHLDDNDTGRQVFENISIMSQIKVIIICSNEYSLLPSRWCFNLKPMNLSMLVIWWVIPSIDDTIDINQGCYSCLPVEHIFVMLVQYRSWSSIIRMIKRTNEDSHRQRYICLCNEHWSIHTLICLLYREYSLEYIQSYAITCK
jgi:hypothetical protein